MSVSFGDQVREMKLPESRPNNLLENLGYQDERVHTGWMKWLLNDLRESRVARQASSILWEYAQPVGERVILSPDSITGIDLRPQEKRGKKIDLEVQVSLEDGRRALLGVEFKVDAKEGKDQFRTFRDAYLKLAEGDNLCSLLLFVLGDAHFLIRNLPPEGWGLMDLQVAQKFGRRISSLLIGDDAKVWNMWIEALGFEALRRQNAHLLLSVEFAELKGASKVKRRAKTWGYRSHGIFLSAYATLIQHLEGMGLKGWRMNTVRGNAVLGSETGIPRAQKEYKFYWEFNDWDFKLKMKIARNESGYKRFRPTIERIQDLAEAEGLTSIADIPEPRRPRKREGQHPTVFEWTRLFGKPDETARAAKAIVASFGGQGGFLDRTL